MGSSRITLLKQMGSGEGYREKAFPEKELHMISCNAFHTIKMTALVQMGIEGHAYD